jgi:phosphate uptake regulator
MDTRYLQMTSGGSYLISLPKDWVSENGLAKGSQVGLARLGPSALMVESSPMAKPKPQATELDLTEDVGRALTASYLSGYDRILIKSKKMITSTEKEIIRTAASRLAGMEVINETSDSLLLVSLVVPIELSVEEVMRRLHQIGSSMLEDAVSALVKGNIVLAQNVVERDDALDRLYFLAIRLLRTAVSDMRAAERVGVLPAQCLDLRFAASMMEKMGDESVDMCSHYLGKAANVRLPEKAIELTKEMTRLYQQATNALLKGDFKLSNTVTRNRGSIAGLISELRVQSAQAPDASRIWACVEHAADHIFDIADVVTER